MPILLFHTHGNPSVFRICVCVAGDSSSSTRVFLLSSHAHIECTLKRRRKAAPALLLHRLSFAFRPGRAAAIAWHTVLKGREGGGKSGLLVFLLLQLVPSACTLSSVECGPRDGAGLRRLEGVKKHAHGRK